MIYAFDYETYYSKTYSVADLGNYGYTHHPEFDPYMLSVVGDNKFEWVGNPVDFDWNLFNGATLLSHNAGFELAVTTRLQELGKIPQVNWADLFDTADLAAYCGYPRSLAEAANFMLGIKADKTMRDKAKGVKWSDFAPEMQELMKEYALTDSRVTLRLFLEYGDRWPEFEREISRLTRDMCVRGTPAAASAKTHLRDLEKRLMNAKATIPWIQEDPDAPVLSLKRAGMEARKHGITPPSSFAKDSPEFEAWLEEHGEKFPWARALGDFRSINALHKKVETLCLRTDDSGTFHYGLKYFGAHTGRDSGDGGFNVQNLPREPMHGVDLRSLVIAAPQGYTLGIIDESAIEPRCLAVLAGDTELVKMLNAGYDPYEAKARADGQYDDPRPLKDVDPELRRFKKVEVLGLGYGAGPEKARIIAKQWAGLDLTMEESEAMVQHFRSRRFIPDLWNKLEQACRASAPGDFELELPSGRTLTYRDVKNFGSLSAVIPRLRTMMRVKLWGGALTENLIQAVARDIFMWHVQQVTNAGYQILLRAHDEIVVLLKWVTAEQDLNSIAQIMGTPPPWMPEFPAKAEGGLSTTYKKI